MRTTPRRTAVVLLSALALAGLTGSVAHADGGRPAGATTHQVALKSPGKANSWTKTGNWKHRDANSWSNSPDANSWSNTPDANSWSNTPDANSWSSVSDGALT